MYNGQIREKINEIFDTETEDSQDAFISDLRKSLSETHDKFNKTATTLLLLIGAHFLSTSGVDDTVKVFGIDLPEGEIFQSAVLFVTSIVFLALSCLSYLKKYREC